MVQAGLEWSGYRFWQGVSLMNRFGTCPNRVKHPISRGQNVGKVEIPKHIITDITVLGSIMQWLQWLYSPSSLVISVLSVQFQCLARVLFIVQKRNHEIFENWMPHTYINSIEPSIPPRTSRSPSVSHGMSNAESCALDANGKLMDASKIVWYNESQSSWWCTATVSLIDASWHKGSLTGCFSQTVTSMKFSYQFLAWSDPSFLP